MKLIVKPTAKLSGEAVIPSSKSHTIRAFIFASLAEGTSKISNALESEDTRAAIEACRALGAKIEKKSDGEFEVTGFAGKPTPTSDQLNTLNSGTTTSLIASIAALSDKKITIDGDESIKTRTLQPLLTALNNLGATALSTKNNGCPPVEIQGPLLGGKTDVNCRSSQYISSLLITCPLLEQDTEITIKNLCEQPYIEMTLKWLDELGIRYNNNDFKTITVPGNQRYKSFEKSIPGDWSSATFLLVAGALLGDNLLIKGLNPDDTQADKQVIEYLKAMGADIRVEDSSIIINKVQLKGCELDLNNTPDALPAISVLACFAEGRTIIKNVAHARIKETDRIKVMASELNKLGAEVEEMDDGLIISQSKLKGAKLKGHNDHRVVMALSIAGMLADGATQISTAEAVNITFPDYVQMMKKLGANIVMEEK
jgi:3-phosphoshikimate 1-carboxyvinyltransferase